MKPPLDAVRPRHASISYYAKFFSRRYLPERNLRDGNRIDYDLCGEGNVSMLKKSLTAVIVGYVVQALALLLLAAAAGVCIFAASSGSLPFIGGESGAVSEQPYVPPDESIPEESFADVSEPPAEESEVTPADCLAALEDCRGRSAGGQRRNDRPAWGGQPPCRGRRFPAGRAGRLHGGRADGLPLYHRRFGRGARV